MTILDSLHEQARGDSHQIDEEIRETRFIDVKHDGRTGRGRFLQRPRPAMAMVLYQARQLATTFTWAVDPQAVETNTWRPELVSRT
jgi:hypothetical protein